MAPFLTLKQLYPKHCPELYGRSPITPSKNIINRFLSFMRILLLKNNRFVRPNLQIVSGSRYFSWTMFCLKPSFMDCYLCILFDCSVLPLL